MSDENKTPRQLIGTVISTAMDKSIVVYIERRVRHPLYGKYMKRSTKLIVHDPEGVAGKGDKVRIELVKPISKRKSWVLAEILEKNAA